MSSFFNHQLFCESNIKGLIKSLERKNGVSGSIDNKIINMGVLNTDIFIEQNTTIEGPITGISTLNISGNTTLQGPITGLSSLYISGTTNLQGAVTCSSTFNVSGNTLLQGPLTCSSSINVSGNTSLQGALTCSSSINVSGNTTLQGQTSLLSSLNVSGVTTITNTLNAYEIKQITQDGTYYPLIAPGSVMSFAGTSAPYGWFICDGSAVSRTDYASLFNVISTTYGSGNGSTTFNLPDIKGKVVVGYNSSETEFNNLGKVGGAKTHTLSISEMPSHNHSYTKTNNGSNGYYDVSGATNDIEFGSSNTGLTGGDQPHNNLQPYITLNYIIKY